MSENEEEAMVAVNLREWQRKVLEFSDSDLKKEIDVLQSLLEQFQGAGGTPIVPLKHIELTKSKQAVLQQVLHSRTASLSKPDNYAIKSEEASIDPMAKPSRPLPANNVNRKSSSNSTARLLVAPSGKAQAKSEFNAHTDASALASSTEIEIADLDLVPLQVKNLGPIDWTSLHPGPQLLLAIKAMIYPRT